MNVALRKLVDLQAFLAWEERQELRHEFDGIQPVAMTGGTPAHAVVQNNLHIAVGGCLRGKPCRFFDSDLKVLTARTSRYPDGVVTCTPWDNSDTAVPEPVVIFEVLSRSTASTDHITKNREYASLPTVQRYVMLEQERIGAIVFSRSGDDWIGHVLANDAFLAIPEIGIELPLAELYENLDFSTADISVPEGGLGRCGQPLKELWPRTGASIGKVVSGGGFREGNYALSPKHPLRINLSTAARLLAARADCRCFRVSG